jgi:hypothetical protein
VHNNIIENAYGEFYGSYAESPCDTAPDKRHGIAAVYDVKHREHKTSRQGHGPVSISAHDYFDKAVTEISHKKRK